MSMTRFILATLHNEKGETSIYGLPAGSNDLCVISGRDLCCDDFDMSQPESQEQARVFGSEVIAAIKALDAFPELIKVYICTGWVDRIEV